MCITTIVVIMSEPGEQSSPSPEVGYTRLPNGEWIGIFELMERQKTTEAELNTAVLKPGDLLAGQYPKDEDTLGGFFFKVESTKWNHLGIEGNFSPSPRIMGRLQGPDLPPEVSGKEAEFSGSGWGGPMFQAGIIGTGRAPYFFLEDGQYRAPIISNFKIFRKDEKGELQPLEPNQLDAEIRKRIEKHHDRVTHVEELMKLFGFTRFDFRDSTKTSHDYRQTPIDEPLPPRNDLDLQFEDERYKAQYVAGMAMGNQLAILDKDINLWMEYKYYNFNNEDILQVAFADLSSHDLNEVFNFGEIVYESRIHGTDEAITTFTTSGRYGIDAANYKPSEREAAEILDIPGIDGSIYSPTPDIQLLPDGEVNIPLVYPFNGLETEHPGLNQRIKEAVKFSVRADGSLSLTLNSKEIPLIDPDAQLNSLIAHMTQNTEPAAQNAENSTVNQENSKIRRVGQAVGRFIRRKNK